MREVGLLEAKTHLSALVADVERGGETIVITRHGKPVAELKPSRAVAGDPQRRLSGPELAGRFRKLRERISRESPKTDNLT
ncbi:type II toxin-antitoxin system Phd/YefM family antitoxin, partial [Phenylobacterium sp.]|uniref:type II toxin-antitoxin system Phd/YefM family antitoxin n=1 Tax=Phenylobacterium sp. TaxID=1871053 RepID=UPI0039830D89